MGDSRGALARLSPDVVSTAAGGPRRRAARRPVDNALRAARLLINLSRRYAGRMEVTPVSVNGDVGYTIEVDGVIDQIVPCSVSEGRVAVIRNMRNPDKLQLVGTHNRLSRAQQRGSRRLPT
jgi:RNA polymerase sigma-70 factor (ECF subfamily)